MKRMENVSSYYNIFKQKLESSFIEQNYFVIRIVPKSSLSRILADVFTMHIEQESYHRAIHKTAAFIQEREGQTVQTFSFLKFFFFFVIVQEQIEMNVNKQSLQIFPLI